MKNYEPYSAYLSYSQYSQVRFLSSSGGFCKSFLIYLIEYKKVDYVIITRTGSSKFPLIPETIITNNKEEVISTRTNSIYAPTNPLKVLRKIDKNKAYAFVGLPCHCNALRNMQEKGLYKCIKIIICLFCNHTPKIGFTEKILANLGVEKKDIKKIEYRGHGWPGKFTVYLSDNSKKQIDSPIYWKYNKDYYTDYCKNCSLLPFYSDISICDPWGLGFEKEDNQGKTMVLCNNKKSDLLVMEAEKKKFLILENCTDEQFIKSQGEHIRLKKLKNQIKNE